MIQFKMYFLDNVIKKFLGDVLYDIPKYLWIKLIKMMFL